MNAITVRWDGAHSETTPDNFTQEIEFEGYRVYLARDERHSSFSVLQSYDLEDYNKWVWDDSVVSEGRLGAFVLKESPFTLQELRCQYAPNGCDDVDWFPLDYSRSRPYVYSSGGIDSIFHFESQDYNQSILANYPNNTTDIRKRFPSAAMPSVEWIDDTTLIPDSLRNSVLTEGGYFKFYEYEYILENMLPTVPYGSSGYHSSSERSRSCESGLSRSSRFWHSRSPTPAPSFLLDARTRSISRGTSSPPCSCSTSWLRKASSPWSKASPGFCRQTPGPGRRSPCPAA